MDTSSLLQIFPHGLVCLDVETTGLSPLLDSITELAAVKLTPMGELQTWQTLVNPQMPIPKEITAINQITDELVQHSPSIGKVLPDFLSFVGALPLVAHNAKFDLGFLVLATQRQGFCFANNAIYCSCQWSRKSFPQLTHYSLKALAQYLVLPPFAHHRALDDAKTCLAIAAACLALSAPTKPRPFAHTHQYPSLQNFQLPPSLMPFLEFIRTQTPMLIHYQGGSLQNKYRPIKPCSLLPLPHGPVLYSLCLLADQYKSFKLAKIKDIKLSAISEWLQP